jgi:S-adenosylmethionine:tRNA-ribosyltransferase-isomerase (queuine synthetase)
MAKNYSIFHTAKCGVVRKIQDFKTYEGMKLAFDAAIKNPQKYSKYGDIAKITVYDASMNPVAQITDILEK